MVLSDALADGIRQEERRWRSNASYLPVALSQYWTSGRIRCGSPFSGTKCLRSRGRATRRRWGNLIEKTNTITGGAGFIGSSLALRLKDDFDVVIFDNLHRNAFERRRLPGPSVTLVKGDVLDLQAVRQAASCSVVFHMASIAGVDTVMKNPVLTMKVAPAGTMNVLEAKCPDWNRSTASSIFPLPRCSASTPTRSPKATSPSLAPSAGRWTYAVSKLATEHLALNYHKQYGLPRFRYDRSTSSPQAGRRGAIHHFIRRALAGEDVVVHNDGSQIRACCYIDDIIDALLLVMERPEAVGRPSTSATREAPCTIYNLAREVIRIAGSRSRIVQKDWPFADVELRIPDISKARRLLGFEPSWNLEDGLERTVDWYREFS